MARRQLTDAQDATLAPLLPPEKPVTGRPSSRYRTKLNGIVWRLGELPERSGTWDTGRPLRRTHPLRLHLFLVVAIGSGL